MRLYLTMRVCVGGTPGLVATIRGLLVADGALALCNSAEDNTPSFVQTAPGRSSAAEDMVRRLAKVT
jgi:hypothetical protein